MSDKMAIFWKHFTRAARRCCLVFGAVGLFLGTLWLGGTLSDVLGLSNPWPALIVSALFAIEACVVYAAIRTFADWAVEVTHD